MSKFDFDLFVIGGGSGGVRGARWAASLGAKVGICEESRYGGTCVIKGCIPKKFMVYGSHFSSDFKLAESYGWSLGKNTFSWSKLKENREKEITRLEGIYEKILTNNKVQTFKGRGVIKDPHTVEVAGKRVTAKNILIATGGRPYIPNIPGSELMMSSDDFFQLDEMPRSVVIPGGGFIAVELGGVLNALGAQVDIVIRKEHILTWFDQDLREFLQSEIQKKGINIHQKLTVDSVGSLPDKRIEASLSDGNKIQADKVLCAMGRIPNTVGLGLENMGVSLDDGGRIVVDQHFQTNIPSIFAVGDVVNKMNLTPVALREAVVVAENLFSNKEKQTFSYYDVPSAVFSQPPLSTVGPSEEKARQIYGDIDVYLSEFRPLKFTLSEINERTLMKLIVDRKSQKVVACHMVGADAPEIIQGMAIAIKAGATKEVFDSTVGIHPTSAEEFTTLRVPTR